MSKVKIAAVGDIHLTQYDSYNPFPDIIGRGYDALLLAGDLTQSGTIEEMLAVVRMLKPICDAGIPVIAVLGNHDMCQDLEAEHAMYLRNIGVITLDSTPAIATSSHTKLDVRGIKVGIAGTRGFGGGFGNRDGANFGERMQRRFMSYTEDEAAALEKGLRKCGDCDVKIALTHYSPIRGTVANEHPEIYAWLGSSELLHADRRGEASLHIHGHAHKGPYAGNSERLLVRNVAYPVLQTFKYPKWYATLTYSDGRWSDS